jgi:hypothetical protein
MPDHHHVGRAVLYSAGEQKKEPLGAFQFWIVDALLKMA